MPHRLDLATGQGDPVYRMEEILKRTVVVGCSCSGKTSLAARLAECMRVPHIELDAIHWQANWRPLPRNDFREVVRKKAAGDRWVIEGNYEQVRDIVLKRATAVIWLNYRFPTVFGRALSRTFRRFITRERLFNDNRESFRNTFLSRESILLWVIKTHGPRKREYRGMFEGETYPHLEVVECTKPRDANAFLRLLEEGPHSEVVQK